MKTEHCCCLRLIPPNTPNSVACRSAGTHGVFLRTPTASSTSATAASSPATICWTQIDLPATAGPWPPENEADETREAGIRLLASALLSRARRAARRPSILVGRACLRHGESYLPRVHERIETKYQAQRFCLGTLRRRAVHCLQSVQVSRLDNPK